jgi:hypothetical protein
MLLLPKGAITATSVSHTSLASFEPLSCLCATGLGSPFPILQQRVHDRHGGRPVQGACKISLHSMCISLILQDAFLLDFHAQFWAGLSLISLVSSHLFFLGYQSTPAEQNTQLQMCQSSTCTVWSCVPRVVRGCNALFARQNAAWEHGED